MECYRLSMTLISYVIYIYIYIMHIIDVYLFMHQKYNIIMSMNNV